MHSHFPPPMDGVNNTSDENITRSNRKRHIESPPTLRHRKVSIGSNLLNFRANSSTSFINAHGVITNLKTGAYIDERQISNPDHIPLQFPYSTIPSDRPLTITSFSAKGSPQSAKTPGGTKMFRSEQGAFLNVFTNNPDLEVDKRSPFRAIPINTNFSASSPYKSVLENTTDFYTQTIQINAAQLAKIKTEQANNGTSRNQNKVMTKAGHNPSSASATRYATAAKLNDNNLSWEWLHQIAFRFIGKDGQVPDNLGCGTAHANTEMLITESALPAFVNIHSEGIHLTVTSHYIKTTRILTKIDYILNIDNQEFRAHFNAQRQTQPLKVSADYQIAFFRGLAEAKPPTRYIDTVELRISKEHSSLFADAKNSNPDEPLTFGEITPTLFRM